MGMCIIVSRLLHLLVNTIYCNYTNTKFHPRTSLVAQMVKNLLGIQENWVGSLGQEDLLEKGMAAYSNILA